MMAADGHFDDADADASTTLPCVVLALETGTGSRRCCCTASCATMAGPGLLALVS